MKGERKQETTFPFSYSHLVITSPTIFDTSFIDIFNFFGVVVAVLSIVRHRGRKCSRIRQDNNGNSIQRYKFPFVVIFSHDGCLTYEKVKRLPIVNADLISALTDSAFYFNPSISSCRSHFI